ncbi:MAG: hypothetical protein WBA09_22425 [Candidatus Acidiferrum sp.]
MVNALFFASLVSVLWVAGFSLHVPGLTRWVFAFLLAQALFTGICWLAYQRWANVSEYYTSIYGVCAVLPSLMALGLSVYAERHWPLIIAEIVTLGALFYAGAYLWESGALRVMGAVGAIYAVSGFFLLLSLTRPTDAPWDRVCLILGLFLLVQGMLSLLFVANATAHRAETMAVANWAPSFVALVLMLWLGDYLYRTVK